MRSASSIAIRQVRSACSRGWPMPRSVASESAAINSARRSRCNMSTALCSIISTALSGQPEASLATPSRPPSEVDIAHDDSCRQKRHRGDLRSSGSMRKPVAKPPNKVEDASCELNGGFSVFQSSSGKSGSRDSRAREQRAHPTQPQLVLRRGKGPRGIFEVIDSDEPRRHHQVKNFAVDGPTGTAHISSDSAASLKFGGRSNDQTHARYLCGACGYGSACHTCVRSRRDLIDTEFPWCVPSVPCRLHLWRT